MRAAFFAATLVALVVSGSFGGSAGAVCGRLDYPNATAYDPASVVNETLWQAFRDAGGFAGGNESAGAVEVRVPDGGTVHVVRVEEVVVRAYVGGIPSDRTAIALRVRDETAGGPVEAWYNFTLQDFDGRAGGNLTVVARLSGGGLEIFWRWAYLACAEDYPNAYYVFHGRVAGGRVADDNRLVYFQAPRPSRGPPSDLILLVTAGIAVTVIFLLARRALKQPAERTDERTPNGSNRGRR